MEVTMKQHKIELVPNAKLIKTKQSRWNPKYIAMVKEKLHLLLKGGSLSMWKQLNGFLLWY